MTKQREGEGISLPGRTMKSNFNWEGGAEKKPSSFTDIFQNLRKFLDGRSRETEKSFGREGLRALIHLSIRGVSLCLGGQKDGSRG